MNKLLWPIVILLYLAITLISYWFSWRVITPNALITETPRQGLTLALGQPIKELTSISWYNVNNSKSAIVQKPYDVQVTLSGNRTVTFASVLLFLRGTESQAYGENQPLTSIEIISPYTFPTVAEALKYAEQNLQTVIPSLPPICSEQARLNEGTKTPSTSVISSCFFDLEPNIRILVGVGTSEDIRLLSYGDYDTTYRPKIRIDLRDEGECCCH
jgi:hypothetical protein